MLSPIFRTPSSDLQLSSGEIHIWMSDLDQPESEYGRLMQVLSTDERMRAGRFRFPKDQKRFIARHGMLRMLLGCYLGVKASEIRFTEGKNGKPEIVETFGKKMIHFNITHAEGVALFAFDRNNEIGTDLERIRDFPEMDHIADRFFSAGEKSFFRASPQSIRKEAFFTCWTRKEAFVKATGDGLSMSLEKLDIAPVLAEGGVPLISEGTLGEEGEEAGWSIHTFQPVRDYVGALAMKGSDVTPRCFKWISTIAN